MIRVKLTKVKELKDALHPNNIAEGFTKVGEYHGPPKVGETFDIGSSWSTSTVQEILTEKSFRTLNSIYTYEFI
jgi:hypothetical protein